MRTENIERLQDTRLSKSNPQFLVYKYLFADLQKAIKSYAHGKVLDIGCGNKPYQHWFDGFIVSYTGCDVVQSSSNKVDILCSATDIPLVDNSFDTVFSTQVIEHVADHNGLLQEAFRLLCSGGTLIISGPMYWEHHEEPYDFFRFTKWGFEHILTEAGFMDIQLIANGGKWALTGQMLQNNLRSSFGETPLRKALGLIYRLFRIKWLINTFFDWLDRKDRSDISTLNWVAIAKKP
jgi:SAM-dependent methyltransferase